MYIHANAREFKPNAHVFLILIAKVAELLGMNILLCRNPPLLSRLFFTMAVSVVMSIHYLYTAMCTDEYPIIHSGGRLMEVCISAVILLTLFLHAMTMYFVDGSVDFRRLVFHRSNMPRRTDDFSLAVLKLGSACLHATQLTGLSCELKALDAPMHTYVELYPDGRTVIEHSIEDYEKMECDGINAFEKEIKDVRVEMEQSRVEMGGVVRGVDKMRAMWDFFGTLFEILWHMVSEVGQYFARYLPEPPDFVRNIPRNVRLVWHGTTGEAQRMARLEHESLQRTQAIRAHERMEHLRRRRDLQILRQRSPSTWSRGDDLNAAELVALAENSQSNSTSLVAFQDVLVKHMLRPDHAPPLTRSEYRQMATPPETPPNSDSWMSFLSARAEMSNTRTNSDRHTQLTLVRLLQERRDALWAQSPDTFDRERARLCVVCCSEDRTIICWPCRCLALCDSCRGTLANQQHALLALHASQARAMQLCPTCRAPIAAFSRLYLP